MNVVQEIESVEWIEENCKSLDYIADRRLATSIFLSLKLRKPLFLEGEAGVGKTEVAKILSSLLGRQLIRLQCYEGLDVNTAVYEWNYSRQMLQIRLFESLHRADPEAAMEDIFSPRFLLKRPLLQAVDYAGEKPPVLLVDELDRADEEFEAYLLEVLSDFQISIPEIGTIRATQPPVVVITSNRTREIHDALKRRCLYCWIDYPDFEKEYQIVLSRVPDAPRDLAREVVGFVQELRREDLFKRPGVAETLDWVAALVALNEASLSEELIDDTLGALLKYREDVEHVRGAAAQRILSHGELARKGRSQSG